MKVGFWAFAALANPNIAAHKPSATLKIRILMAFSCLRRANAQRIAKHDMEPAFAQDHFALQFAVDEGCASALRQR
jgi:hypothetical protein